MIRFKKVLRQAVLLAGGLIAAEFEDNACSWGKSEQENPEVWRAQNNIPPDGALFYLISGNWKLAFKSVLEAEQVVLVEKVADDRSLHELYFPERPLRNYLVLRRYIGGWQPERFVSVRNLEASMGFSFHWSDARHEIPDNCYIIVTTPEGVDSSILRLFAEEVPVKWKKSAS